MKWGRQGWRLPMAPIFIVRKNGVGIEIFD
jgi:hypothetical protein